MLQPNTQEEWGCRKDVPHVAHTEIAILRFLSARKRNDGDTDRRFLETFYGNG